MRSINFVPLTLLFCFAAAIGAQSTPSASPPQTAQSQKTIPAVNPWRSEAKDLATEGDTVSPDVRAARDAYWNQAYPVTKTPSGSVATIGLGPGTSNPPQELDGIEIPLWVIGRFESFHVYATSNGVALYTEINFRVQHIFDGHPHTGLAEGQLIDIAIMGGAAISNGKRSEFGLNLNHWQLMQPGHTYLTFITPNLRNVGTYNHGMSWDLTSGVVRPAYDDYLGFTTNGKSKIDGTPASTIVPRFQALIDQAIQKKGAK